MAEAFSARASSVSLSISTWTAQDFATEEVDTDGYHDTVTNNTRITFPENNYYLVHGFHGHGSDVHDRKIRLKLNGTTTYRETEHRGNTTSQNPGASIVDVRAYDAGDYIEAEVFSSGTITTGRTIVNAFPVPADALFAGNLGTPDTLVAATPYIVDLVESIDTASMHDDVTNPSRVTIATTGRYVVFGQASWDEEGSTEILLNGAGLFVSWKWNDPSGERGGPVVWGIVDLSASDYLELQITSGTNDTLEEAFLFAYLIDSGTPAALAHKSADDTGRSGFPAVLTTFDSETVDTDAFHSTSTNTGRLTIPSGEAGIYMVCASNDMEGFRAQHGLVYLNGVEEYDFCVNSQTGTDRGTTFGMVILDLAVGDYLEMFTIHDSGSGLTQHTEGTRFGLVKLGDVPPIDLFVPQIYRRL